MTVVGAAARSLRQQGTRRHPATGQKVSPDVAFLCAPRVEAHRRQATPHWRAAGVIRPVTSRRRKALRLTPRTSQLAIIAPLTRIRFGPLAPALCFDPGRDVARGEEWGEGAFSPIDSRAVQSRVAQVAFATWVYKRPTSSYQPFDRTPTGRGSRYHRTELHGRSRAWSIVGGGEIADNPALWLDASREPRLRATWATRERLWVASRLYDFPRIKISRQIK